MLFFALKPCAKFSFMHWRRISFAFISKGTDYLRYGRFELRAWSRSELNFNLKAPLYQWKNTQQVFPTSLMWRKSRASKVMA